MKKTPLLFFLFTLVIFTVYPTVSLAIDSTHPTCSYIGNSQTHIFHTLTCEQLSHIADDNIVCFSIRQEAADAGYSPCPVCNP